jgi:hypothetical protein
MTRRVVALALLLAGALALGFACPGANVVALDRPADGLFVEDPDPAVRVAGRVGSSYAMTTVELRLDGVDLIDALGLTPPFSGASGVVSIGGSSVTISDFSFTAGAGVTQRPISLQAEGLALGAHAVELEARNAQGTIVTRHADFEITDPFALAGEDLPAAGQPAGAQGAGAEGVLANSALAAPLAAPPVPLSGGGELRAGFVPAAAARTQGGTP